MPSRAAAGRAGGHSCCREAKPSPLEAPRAAQQLPDGPRPAAATVRTMGIAARQPGVCATRRVPGPWTWTTWRG
jgi:hypothetical protein